MGCGDARGNRVARGLARKRNASYHISRERDILSPGHDLLG